MDEREKDEIKRDLLYKQFPWLERYVKRDRVERIEVERLDQENLRDHQVLIYHWSFGEDGGWGWRKAFLLDEAGRAVYEAGIGEISEDMRGSWRMALLRIQRLFRPQYDGFLFDALSTLNEKRRASVQYVVTFGKEYRDLSIYKPPKNQSINELYYVVQKILAREYQKDVEQIAAKLNTKLNV